MTGVYIATDEHGKPIAVYTERRHAEKSFELSYSRMGTI